MIDRIMRQVPPKSEAEPETVYSTEDYMSSFARNRLREEDQDYSARIDEILGTEEGYASSPEDIWVMYEELNAEMPQYEDLNAEMPQGFER